MKTNNIIIHISDLHITLDQNETGGKNDSFAYIQYPNGEDQSQLFIDKFITKIKEETEQFASQKIHLLITGDISDKGKVLEFSKARDFLEKIKERLGLRAENIILIPGDHDLNRMDIQTLLTEELNPSNEEVNNRKFKNFSNFYKDITGTDFNPNKIIFNTYDVEDKFTLICINSSYGIDLQQKDGMIDIDKFRTELQEIPKTDLKKILVCHHNIISAYENKAVGQWDINNRKNLINILEEFDIKYILSGNEHTNSYRAVGASGLNVSDAGSLSASKNSYCSFKIYEVLYNQEDEIVSLSNTIFGLQKTEDINRPFFWNKISNKDANQPDNIIISQNKPPALDDDIGELPSVASGSETKDIKLEKEEEENIEVDIYESPYFSDGLYKKVQEKNAFHSGHFHWSETSRAHNWIEISKLIEDKETFQFLKEGILNLVEDKTPIDNIDLIIGLGYEGNMIATKTVLKYGKPYVFLPYSYRWDEHKDYEKNLVFNNKDKSIKNVLIISDVVNDGRTIRKLIKEKYWNELFKNVDTIYVASLFYTGHQKINTNILNTDYLKNNKIFNPNNDYEVNNIKFYTIRCLRVEKCPYGDDFRESCLIYKDNLSCVHLFYDEKPFLKQKNKPSPNGSFGKSGS